MKCGGFFKSEKSALSSTSTIKTNVRAFVCFLVLHSSCSDNSYPYSRYSSKKKTVRVSLNLDGETWRFSTGNIFRLFFMPHFVEMEIVRREIVGEMSAVLYVSFEANNGMGWNCVGFFLFRTGLVTAVRRLERGLHNIRVVLGGDALPDPW